MGTSTPPDDSPRLTDPRTEHSRAEAARSRYHIEALARGIAVLEAFSADRPELSLTDLARLTSLNSSSVLRIVQTLADAGYLARNPITRGYRLGSRVLALGLTTLSSMTLPELAEPYLIDLRNRTQETVNLAIQDGINALIVGHFPSRVHSSAASYIGTHIPLHIGSLGRVMLAWLPSDEAEAILARAEDRPPTPKTIALDRVRLELARTRRRGYALNDQGTTLEHRSVAAPLLDPSGRPVGAVNLSVSARRVTLADLERKLAPKIVDCARQVSAIIPPEVRGAASSILPDENFFLTDARDF